MSDQDPSTLPDDEETAGEPYGDDEYGGGDDDGAWDRGPEFLGLPLGAWGTAIVVTVFTVGVWAIFTFIVEPNQGRGPTGPQKATRAVLGFYHAAHGAGLRTFQSSDPEELARHLRERVGPHASIPDLSAVGLVPSGVKQANMPGGGWGMVQYVSGRTSGVDVIALFSRKDGMLVPAHAEARQVNGTTVWLQETKATAWIAYVEGENADWVLTSSHVPTLLEAAGEVAR